MRTFIASCLQEVIVGLQALTDRDQENLCGLTLAQILRTPLCGLSLISEENGVEHMLQGVTGLPSKGKRIFLLCFLNRGVKVMPSPERRHQLGKKTD